MPSLASVYYLHAFLARTEQRGVEARVAMHRLPISTHVIFCILILLCQHVFVTTAAKIIAVSGKSSLTVEGALMSSLLITSCFGARKKLLAALF